MRTFSSKKINLKKSGIDHGDRWLSENPLLKWYWFCLYWFTTSFSCGHAKISPAQCNNSTACGWLFNTLARVEVREDGWGGRKRPSERKGTWEVETRKVWGALTSTCSSKLSAPLRPSLGLLPLACKCVYRYTHTVRMSLISEPLIRLPPPGN